MTLTLFDGSTAHGVLIEETDTHVYLKLTELYEIEQGIWLPGDKRGFAKDNIASQTILPQEV